MAKKSKKVRAFTGPAKDHSFYELGTWQPVVDVRVWIVNGNGKSFIETNAGERFQVAHYVPGETLEQFQADGLDGSRRRMAQWEANFREMRASLGDWAT